MKIGRVQLNSNIVLAPMAGYGDVAMRRLCRDYGAGLTTTEMVSVKGLVYENAKTQELLRLAQNEVPSCLQLFGGDPDCFSRALQLDCLSPFKIIDINFGCPVGKITKNGEGSALMRDLKTAEKIIAACVKNSGGREITAKFRLGWDSKSINAVQFAQMAEASGASALTVHGRTKDQLYSGRADWEQIALVAAAVKIPVFGNGDVTSATECDYRLKNSGCAGISIGRGALGHPEIFAEVSGDKTSETLHDDLLTVILKHIDYMLEYFPPFVTVRAMRKHLPFYLKGVKNCKEIKGELNYITDINVLKNSLIKAFKEVTL